MLYVNCVIMPVMNILHIITLILLLSVTLSEKNSSVIYGYNLLGYIIKMLVALALET